MPANSPARDELLDPETLREWCAQEKWFDVIQKLKISVNEKRYPRNDIAQELARRLEWKPQTAPAAFPEVCDNGDLKAGFDEYFKNKAVRRKEFSGEDSLFNCLSNALYGKQDFRHLPFILRQVACFQLGQFHASPKAIEMIQNDMKIAHPNGRQYAGMEGSAKLQCYLDKLKQPGVPAGVAALTACAHALEIELRLVQTTIKRQGSRKASAPFHRRLPGKSPGNLPVFYLSFDNFDGKLNFGILHLPDTGVAAPAQSTSSSYVTEDKVHYIVKDTDARAEENCIYLNNIGNVPYPAGFPLPDGDGFKYTIVERVRGDKKTEVVVFKENEHTQEKIEVKKVSLSCEVGRRAKTATEKREAVAARAEWDTQLAAEQRCAGSSTLPEEELWARVLTRQRNKGEMFSILHNKLEATVKKYEEDCNFAPPENEEEEPIDSGDDATSINSDGQLAQIASKVHKVKRHMLSISREHAEESRRVHTLVFVGVESAGKSYTVNRVILALLMPMKELLACSPVTESSAQVTPFETEVRRYPIPAYRCPEDASLFPPEDVDFEVDEVRKDTLLISDEDFKRHLRSNSVRGRQLRSRFERKKKAEDVQIWVTGEGDSVTGVCQWTRMTQTEIKLVLKYKSARDVAERLKQWRARNEEEDHDHDLAAEIAAMIGVLPTHLTDADLDNYVKPDQVVVPTRFRDRLGCDYEVVIKPSASATWEAILTEINLLLVQYTVDAHSCWGLLRDGVEVFLPPRSDRGPINLLDLPGFNRDQPLRHKLAVRWVRPDPDPSTYTIVHVMGGERGKGLSDMAEGLVDAHVLDGIIDDPSSRSVKVVKPLDHPSQDITEDLMKSPEECEIMTSGTNSTVGKWKSQEAHWWRGQLRERLKNRAEREVDERDPSQKTKNVKEQIEAGMKKISTAAPVSFHVVDVRGALQPQCIADQKHKEQLQAYILQGFLEEHVLPRMAAMAEGFQQRACQKLVTSALVPMFDLLLQLERVEKLTKGDDTEALLHRLKPRLPQFTRMFIESVLGTLQPHSTSSQLDSGRALTRSDQPLVSLESMMKKIDDYVMAQVAHATTPDAMRERWEKKTQDRIEPFLQYDKHNNRLLGQHLRSCSRHITDMTQHESRTYLHPTLHSQYQARLLPEVLKLFESVKDKVKANKPRALDEGGSGGGGESELLGLILASQMRTFNRQCEHVWAAFVAGMAGYFNQLQEELPEVFIRRAAKDDYEKLVKEPGQAGLTANQRRKEELLGMMSVNHAGSIHRTVMKGFRKELHRQLYRAEQALGRRIKGIQRRLDIITADDLEDLEELEVFYFTKQAAMECGKMLVAVSGASILSDELETQLAEEARRCSCFTLRERTVDEDIPPDQESPPDDDEDVMMASEPPVRRPEDDEDVMMASEPPVRRPEETQPDSQGGGDARGAGGKGSRGSQEPPSIPCGNPDCKRIGKPSHKWCRPKLYKEYAAQQGWDMKGLQPLCNPCASVFRTTGKFRGPAEPRRRQSQRPATLNQVASASGPSAKATLPRPAAGEIRQPQTSGEQRRVPSRPRDRGYEACGGRDV
ncbi:hypothetical protein CYMTET_50089 [Cymbomonas tetramitiformis]|uniref:Uncharacterized protein n=1 Tax=Cymbomonas tetramitiformis TaxID=36881 RepID=A0AAE0BQI7_9CHLO|nr:hypothetical protein CYMTET_50089 [Cymbomonas tetramitiformis]